jgi:hypothetical protein
VRLSAAPSKTVTASAVMQGTSDADLTVTAGSSLTFNSNNWGTWHPVTVAAAEDADETNGSRVLRLHKLTTTSDVVQDKDVTVNEADDEVTLTVCPGGSGTTTPAGTIVVDMGSQMPLAISATASNPRTLINTRVTVETNPPTPPTTQAFNSVVPVTLPNVDGDYRVKVEVQDDLNTWSDPAEVMVRLQRGDPALDGPPEVLVNDYGVVVNFKTNRPCIAELRCPGKSPKTMPAGSKPQKSFSMAFIRPEVMPNENLTMHIHLTDEANRTFDSDNINATVAGEAKTSYISPSGTDAAEAGGPGNPWQTLQYAVDRSLPGDTVILTPGVYADPVMLTHGGYNESARLTIQGETAMTELPNSDAGPNQGSPNPSGPHYLNVDDAPHDGDSSVLLFASAGSKEVYTIADHLHDTDIITSVKVRWVAKKGAGDGWEARAGLCLGTPCTSSQEYYGPTVELSGDYEIREETFLNNPATGQPWSVLDVRAAKLLYQQVSVDMQVPRAKLTEIVLVVTLAKMPVINGGKRHPYLIYLINAPYVTVRQLKYMFFKTYGIHAFLSDHLTVEDCISFLDKGWVGGIHIYTEGSPYGLIQRNLAVGGEFGFHIGGYQYPSPSTVVKHNTVSQTVLAAAKWVYSTANSVQTSNSFVYSGNNSYWVDENVVSWDLLTFNSDYNNLGNDVKTNFQAIHLDQYPPFISTVWPQVQYEYDHLFPYAYGYPFNTGGKQPVWGGLFYDGSWHGFAFWTLAGSNFGLRYEMHQDMNSIFADPLYVDPNKPPASWDWRLKIGSPNIGAGEGGSDIGAFAGGVQP